MKRLEKGYRLLEEMYEDEYYPDHLVDKVREAIEEVVSYLEAGEKSLPAIQEQLDAMTMTINDLQEEFEEEGIALEPGAYDSIGSSVEHVLQHFRIDIELEDAIAEREW